jgi:hypothetical protein
MRWSKSPDASTTSSSSLYLKKKRLSIITSGEEEREDQSPRVVGWKGEEIRITNDSEFQGKEVSPLNSTSSFQSGKNFWMKFLDEEPSLSPSSKVTTPLGREIHPSATEDSSLTAPSTDCTMKTPSSAMSGPSYSSSVTTSGRKRVFRSRSWRSCDGKQKPSPSSISSSVVVYPPGKTKLFQSKEYDENDQFTPTYGVLQRTENGSHVNKEKRELEYPKKKKETRETPSRVLQHFSTLKKQNQKNQQKRVGLRKPQEQEAMRAKTTTTRTMANNRVALQELSKNQENDNFQNIMKKWRTKSDDDIHVTTKIENKKLKAHTSITFEEQSRPNAPTLSATHNNEKDECGIDFFDHMREQLSPRESLGITEKTSGTVFKFGDDSSMTATATTITTASPREVTKFSDTLKATRQSLSSPRTEGVNITKQENTLSSSGNRAIVLVEQNNKYQLLVGETSDSDYKKKEVILRNVDVVSSEEPFMKENDVSPQEKSACEYSRSIFGGNDQLIAFFLPKMSLPCNCGAKDTQEWGLVKPEDPTAIENVLRPWQVRFLHQFGIQQVDQLVKAKHRSSGVLAKAMRQWRIQQGLAPFRTSSCLMAIDIW